MDMLSVKASGGMKYPLQGHPNKYINDADAASVPDTAYYRKALLDGDLVLADQPVEPAPAPASASKSK